MKSRTVPEYRLTVVRTGNAPSVRRYRSMKPLTRRIGVLTSPEPWRFYDDRRQARKDADDYVCCSGTVPTQCSCGGLTMREQTEDVRRNLPPIESIRVDARRITTTPWESVEMPITAPPGPPEEA